MSDERTYFPKLCWDSENPRQDGHPYAFEMFGELYFTENPPKPVTMSELFGGYPKPPLPPSGDQDDEGGEEKTVAKDDAPVVVQNQAPRRFMNRADLNNYVPPVNKEPKGYPPVITPLRHLYKGNPLFQSECDDKNGSKCALPQEKNAVGEGGSSSGVEKEDLAE